MEKCNPKDIESKWPASAKATAGKQKYEPKEIESHWQEYWEKHGTFEVKEDSKKRKFYGLIEFPYPSGAGLHVGHPRSYTAMDVIARKRRMEGFNVLYPIGFDSFGLPTENFAIKTGRPPAEITEENIANFTRQLKALGFSFDWSRAVTTSEPEYYQWTQWIFLQLYKHGLAYKKKQPINWCPKDKIGLANEEVVDGKCERCGGPVEKRDKEQWMLAITKYADKLLDGLKHVDYIERAKLQQENWIGRSEGAEVVFKLRRIPGQDDDKHSLTIFTTRPDTMFGATFVAISPELAKKWLDMGWQASEQVRTYIERELAERVKGDREEKEKTGIDAGFVAVNPANGEEIPVWVANYVMGDVGTGAIMAVPAHDERDFEFAKKFKLPIMPVVVEKISPTNEQEETIETYENTLDTYIKMTPQEVSGVWKEWMDDVLKLAGKKNVHIIEFGSGTGRDADYIESQGYTVERTDVAQSFVDHQKKLGKNAHKFDLLTDAKQYNTYDLAFAHAVLHHFTREQLPQVLQNILRMLKIGGLFAFSVKEGVGEEIEHAKLNKNRYFQYWKKEDIVTLVESVGAEVVDVRSAVGKNSPAWLLITLKKKKEIGLVFQGTMINSSLLNGMDSTKAKSKIIAWLEEKGIGKFKVQYKLRDWVFSRQRYWGEPIPLVWCDKCNEWIPLPENELPLKLPEVKNYQPTDTGESPLAAMTDWVNTKCPKCKGPARRETDTMPNWAGSSWYFLRYCDPKNKKELASPESLKYWMNIDWYNGGMEHTVLHLLYSRFWNLFLHDIGVVPTSEPYQKRTSHGMILASDGQKMSKSLGNVVNPDEMVEQFGADALRTYIMFMGPFDQAIAWDTNGLIGVRRFLDRVWFLQSKVKTEDVSQKSKIEMSLHQTIKKVTEDIEEMRFNTAIAKMMELVNEMNREESISKDVFEKFVLILSPFAPHMAEELWEMLGHKKSVALEAWPAFDPSKIVESEMTLAIQVNGKLRDTIVVAADMGEDEVKKLARGSEKVQKWLEGKEPKKVIYVKGKLVSIVV